MNMKCNSYYIPISFVDILNPHKEPLTQPILATQKHSVQNRSGTWGVRTHWQL